jgi:hypothetical protein
VVILFDATALLSRNYSPLMIKGVGWEAVRGETLALVVFGVAIMTAAALRFRKRLD